MDYSQVMDEKVFIAQPCGEQSRYSDYTFQLKALHLPRQTTFKMVMGIYIPNNQNTLARMFLDSDYTWFWLVNDDQLYPPDTLLKLLLARKDIVVPLALEKKPPHFPLIYDDFDKEGFFSHRSLQRDEYGLVRIYAAGGGGMLCHRSVFERIADPWWTQTMRRNHEGVWEYSSEDFDFAVKVKQAGIEMWCDTDISAVHIMQVGMRPARDPSGEWVTVLIRTGEEIVMPAPRFAPVIDTPKKKEWVTV